jgi:hypothetical protein
MCLGQDSGSRSGGSLQIERDKTATQIARRFPGACVWVKTVAFLFGGNLRIKKRQDSGSHPGGSLSWLTSMVGKPDQSEPLPDYARQDRIAD